MASESSTVIFLVPAQANPQSNKARAVLFIVETIIQTVIPIDYIMIGLGVAALITAVLEAMGMFELRIDARRMTIIGMVLVGRVLLRVNMQNRARQREMMLREVPKRPLGIADDD